MPWHLTTLNYDKKTYLKKKDRYAQSYVTILNLGHRGNLNLFATIHYTRKPTIYS